LCLLLSKMKLRTSLRREAVTAGKGRKPMDVSAEVRG